MELRSSDVDQSNAPALVICNLKMPDIHNHVMDKVEKFLQLRNQDKRQLIVIGSEISVSVFGYFIQLYRLHGLHPNERTTVLGAVDQMLAVQFVLASQNRKSAGDFTVDNNLVLRTNDRLIRWKLSSVIVNDVSVSSEATDDCNFSEFLQDYEQFLRHCNVVDWMDVANCIFAESKTNLDLRKGLVMSDFLIFCERSDSIESHFIRLLSRQKECFKLSVALSLNESFSEKSAIESAELSIEGCSVDDAVSCLSDSTASVSEVFAEQIFAAYLELIVNSRDEFALARVINIPDRKLDHVAFTEIKHEAKSRNMSMCQTILSFIMRIRLGGKSYAPTDNCPLLRYTEGLGNFNDLMQNLQTVVEEEVDAEIAVQKILKILKCRILKSSLHQIRSVAVDEISARLMDQTKLILKMTSGLSMASPNSNASSGGSIVGRRTLRVIRSVLDRCSSFPARLNDADMLNDVFSTSQKTPIRFASLISKFRSPEDGNESRVNQMPNERIVDRQSKKFSVRDESLLGCTEVNSTAKHYRESPSFGLTERVLNSEDRLIISDELSVNKARQPLQKRTIHSLENLSSDETNGKSSESFVKRAKNCNSEENSFVNKNKVVSSSAPKKSAKKINKAKMIPLIKGQQKLNSFFRV